MKNVHVSSTVKSAENTVLNIVIPTGNISVSTEKQTGSVLLSSITSGKQKSSGSTKQLTSGQVLTLPLQSDTSNVHKQRLKCYNAELQTLTIQKLTPAQAFDVHKVWSNQPCKKWDALPKPAIVWIPRKGTFAITKSQPPGAFHKYDGYFITGYTKTAPTAA